MLKKERLSNFELLRIVCMLLIIMQHYALHGVGDSIVNASDIVFVVVKFMSFGGHIAVDCYMMIMGYFSINNKFNTKRLVLLWGKAWLYSVVIVSTLMITGVMDINIIELAKAILPITSGRYWFITVYCIIYLLTPLINKTWKVLSEREQRAVLIIAFFVLSVIPTITFNAIYYVWSPIGVMLWCYLFGAFCRNSIKKICGKKISLLVAGISILFIWLSMLLIFFFDVQQISYNYFTILNTVPTILCACALFVLFSNFHFSNMAVNWLSGSMIGVYLIHDNPRIRTTLWNTLFQVQNQILQATFFAQAVGTIVVVFLGCVFIDKIVDKMLGLLRLDLLLSLMDKQLSKILQKIGLIEIDL